MKKLSLAILMALSIFGNTLAKDLKTIQKIQNQINQIEQESIDNDFKKVAITTLDNSVFWDSTFGFTETKNGKKCVSPYFEFKTNAKNRKIFVDMGLERYVYSVDSIYQHKRNQNIFALKLGNADFAMSIDEIDKALQNPSKQPIKAETTNIIYVDSEMIYISGSLLTKKDAGFWSIKEIKEMRTYPLCSKNNGIDGW